MDQYNSKNKNIYFYQKRTEQYNLKLVNKVLAAYNNHTANESSSYP